MIEDYPYKITKKDTKSFFHLSGIDFGYSNPQYKGLFIIKETNNFILARVKGGSGRVSLGTFTYYSPEYIIFKKKKNCCSELDGIIVNPLGECTIEYTRDNMKEKKAEAINKISQMEETECPVSH